MSELRVQEAQQRVSVCEQRAAEQSRLVEELSTKVSIINHYSLPSPTTTILYMYIGSMVYLVCAATHRLHVIFHYTTHQTLTKTSHTHTAHTTRASYERTDRLLDLVTDGETTCGRGWGHQGSPVWGRRGRLGSRAPCLLERGWV